MNIKKLKKDFVWYSAGAAAPMILSFIKTPIFTRHYSPTDFGNLALINTASNYLNMATFSWIISCVWRFYIHEKNDRELNKFYTNIIVLFFISSIVITVLMLVWILLNDDMALKKLIIANYVCLITNAITTIYFTVMRLDGKSLAYNLCAVGISGLSFAILLVMAFVCNSSIDAMLNCSNIVNAGFIIYILYRFFRHYRFSIKYLSKNTMKEFIAYGFAAVFFNISLSVLSTGDRYVIKIFYSTDKVGIYNQIYNLAQISIITLTGIFSNIINPYMFRLFEEDIHNDDEFHKYLLLYIICILPFTVYFSLYAKEIAFLLLGEKFRVGYRMMPYVMATSFIFGLSDMHETRMKFKNKITAISINLIAACLFNMALNFLLVPVAGYESAAYATLISYIFLYTMDLRKDAGGFNSLRKALKHDFRFIRPAVLILSAQLIFHFLIRSFVTDYTVKSAIAEGIIFLSTFYLCIYTSYVALFKGKNPLKTLAGRVRDLLIKAAAAKGCGNGGEGR